MLVRSSTSLAPRQAAFSQPRGVGKSERSEPLGCYFFAFPPAGLQTKWLVKSLDFPPNSESIFAAIFRTLFLFEVLLISRDFVTIFESSEEERRKFTMF